MVCLPATTTTQAAWIPTDKERYSTHSTAVAQKEPRVAQTRAAGNRRIPQSPSPEGYHNSTNPTSGCTAPPQDFHRSTLFFFGVQNRCFLFPEKKKRFWPQPGRQKTNCKIKHTAFPQKKRRFYLRGICPRRADKKKVYDKTPHCPFKPINPIKPNKQERKSYL